jgi:hypothetical protein
VTFEATNPAGLWRRAFLKAVQPLPPVLASRLVHRHYFGEWPRLHPPRTFNEHIVAKKLWDRDPRYVVTSDKLAMRDWVAERVGAHYLVPLLGSYRDATEIDFDALPDAFVLKTNNGCRRNIVVADRTAVDLEAARAQMARWLAGPSGYRPFKEWAYRDIPPRLLAEEYLTDDGTPPADYKFFCFRGEIHLVQVDFSRFDGHRRILLTPDWQPYPVRLGRDKPLPDRPPPRPDGLAEMLDVSARLGAEFTFVRVDLYSCAGRIYVGELTHTPGGGTMHFIPEEFDRAIGDLWSTGSPLPMERRR